MKSKLYFSTLFLLFSMSHAAFAQTTLKKTLTLKMNPAGKDAIVNEYYPNSPHTNEPDFMAEAWTMGGTPHAVRAYMGFDISAIPTNAAIDTVHLSLFCNTTSTNAQLHSSWTGSPYPLPNDAYLKLITSAWTESGLTWNNQPTTTAVHQVTMPASTSQTQDYPNIDVTQLLKDARASSTPNAFGLMFQMQTEVHYRSLIFASGDHADSTKWPVLTIKYSVPNAITDIENPAGVQVYPNPAVNQVSVYLQDITGVNNISIIDMTGRVLETANDIAAVTHFNLETYANGLYFIRIEKGDTKSTYKFIKK